VTLNALSLKGTGTVSGGHQSSLRSNTVVSGLRTDVSGKLILTSSPSKWSLLGGATSYQLDNAGIKLFVDGQQVGSSLISYRNP
jgi:hypothetical protein